MPERPTPDFPLWFHAASGQWCKKIKKKQVYFGADAQEALAKYLKEWGPRQAGINPRKTTPATITVDQVNVKYLDAQKGKLSDGEITQRTFADNVADCKRIAKVLGRNTIVATLGPPDFRKLKKAIAKTNSAANTAKLIRRYRAPFKFAWDERLIEKPVWFGRDFKGAPKKLLRREQRLKASQVYSAAEVRLMIESAPLPLRAFILLGINAGMGASDIATLPRSTLAECGLWLDFPRVKTEVDRRIPLWPETRAAIDEALVVVREAKSPEHASLAFLTRSRVPWVRVNAKGTYNDEIGKAFSKLLTTLKLKRPGVSFYSLRHTFRTIADATRDKPAIEKIMGHEGDATDMGIHYVEWDDDARLLDVTTHVRNWLLTPVSPPTDSDSSENLRSR
jgi:integrase